MSHEGNDVRVIDRAELEKFAAQRRLPEAVLAQLRSRAKNELSTAAGAPAPPLIGDDVLAWPSAIEHTHPILSFETPLHRVAACTRCLVV